MSQILPASNICDKGGSAGQLGTGGMTMIEIVNAAKPVLLTRKLPYLRSLTLRLYMNDWTPSGIDEADDYEECTFAGYSSQSLSDFGPAYLNAFGQGQSDTYNHQWIMPSLTPTNSIYGYFVTDSNGYLIFADRREEGPFEMDGIGATFDLVINFLEDTLRPT
jgi:hypothetical protein